MNDPGAEDIKKLAHLMDTVIKIPGTNIRLGLDALLGLIPGVGDTVTSLVSMYILVAATKFGLPRVTLLRMGVNVVIDTCLGAIPFLGDVFDVYWKSNTRNVRLLQRHLESAGVDQRRARRSDWLFVLAVLFVVLLILIGMFTLIAWIVGRLFGQ